MIICILVSNSLKKDPRVIKQVKVAVANGNEVFFIGTRDINYDKQFLDNVGCNINIIDLGEKYVGALPNLFMKLKRRWCWFYYPIKMIKRIKPDIIHANDFDTLPSAFLAAKKTKSKLVYDSHEIFCENINIQKKPVRKCISKILERMLVKKVDAMISVSNAAANYFANTYEIKLPTVITNCPYSVEPTKLETKVKHFTAIYSGIMIEDRGYEEYVKSAAYLEHGIKLALLGYGPILDKLKAISSEDNLDNRVSFEKPVEIAEIVPAISKFHVGIVVTKPLNINFLYTVSNKLFEYVQARIPVIMSNIPEHRYLNEKYKFGLIIDEVSPMQISKAINMLAADQELYETLSVNCEKMAKEMCWENESEKLINIYKDRHDKHLN
ncbi:MAG: capsular polysaccharide biosynthesis protein [Firmicutes bacterium]|nr:capsular polysaccharide biosynthesis protein [Bacillota bacterium]